MSGILNKKERVIDVIVTEYGRAEMARGNFNVSYYSFSDAGVQYQISDGNVYYEDEASTLQFEAFSSINDEINPEINNISDFTLDTPALNNIVVSKGKVYEIGPNEEYTQVDSLEGIDIHQQITVDKWKSQKIVKSNLGISDLKISAPKRSVYVLPIREKDKVVDSLPVIAHDPRFANHPVTRAMPPTVMIDGQNVPMKAWPHTEGLETVQEIIDDSFSKNPYAARPERFEISLDNSFRRYHLIGNGQVTKEDTLERLIFVDNGYFYNEDNVATHHVIYGGFTYKKSDGSVVFSRTCTMIFNNGE